MAGGLLKYIDILQSIEYNEYVTYISILVKYNGGDMLNIYFGDMPEAVYNTATYFKYDYEDDWIIAPFVKEMVWVVDMSVVLDSGVIDSPVGEISAAHTFRWRKNFDFGQIQY